MSHPRLPILELHARIDSAVKPLTERHHARLTCKRGCSDCCEDELTVFEVEADRIRQEFAELLATGRPHPPGACAFLDLDGACRIYAARPYVCRTQGLPLRWEEDTDGGERVEYRDICPRNEEGPALERLEKSELWSIGPYEGELAALQLDRRRVRLRDLFTAS